MKNTVIKYYIIAFYLCSTFVLFAQPGDTAPGGLEGDGDSTPGAPIDNYIWILALLGLVFVFLRLRATQKKTI
jgi:hypothetical protein